MTTRICSSSKLVSVVWYLICISLVVTPRRPHKSLRRVSRALLFETSETDDNNHTLLTHTHTGWCYRSMYYSTTSVPCGVHWVNHETTGSVHQCWRRQLWQYGCEGGFFQTAHWKCEILSEGDRWQGRRWRSSRNQQTQRRPQTKSWQHGVQQTCHT